MFFFSTGVRYHNGIPRDTELSETEDGIKDGRKVCTEHYDNTFVHRTS